MRQPKGKREETDESGKKSWKGELRTEREWEIKAQKKLRKSRKEREFLVTSGLET